MESFKCGHPKTPENSRSNGVGKPVRCKICKRKANSQWQKDNPDKVSARNKRVYEKDPKAAYERVQKWNRENRDHVNEYHRNYKREKYGHVEWGSPEMHQKMSKSAKARVERDGWLPTPSPSKLELDCKYLFEPLGYRHTGDGSFWVRGKDGQAKNPDFKKTGSKKVIEVWGDYWHRDHTPTDLIQWYADNGYHCEIYWESELKSLLP